MALAAVHNFSASPQGLRGASADTPASCQGVDGAHRLCRVLSAQVVRVLLLRLSVHSTSLPPENPREVGPWLPLLPEQMGQRSRLAKGHMAQRGIAGPAPTVYSLAASVGQGRGFRGGRGTEGALEGLGSP